VLDEAGFSEDSYMSATVTDCGFVPQIDMAELRAFVDLRVFAWHLVGEV